MKFEFNKYFRSALVSFSAPIAMLPERKVATIYQRRHVTQRVALGATFVVSAYETSDNTGGRDRNLVSPYESFPQLQISLYNTVVLWGFEAVLRHWYKSADLMLVFYANKRKKQAQNSNLNAYLII